MRSLPVVLAMFAAIASVAAVSVWDTERESKHAVERLAQAQATLARALQFDLESRLSVGTESTAIEALLADAEKLGAPRQTLVFIKTADALHGPRASLPASLERLIAGPEARVVIPREDAAALEMEHRRAAAAWQPTRIPQVGILIVASANLERLQAEREEVLSVVSMVLVVALVLALGITVVRRDSERVRLNHALERETLMRERDEQLSRAERIGVASALSLGIAHELATPLGVISAKVETLKRHATEEKTSSALTVMSEQVAAMRQVMQGFLSLARGDAPATTLLTAESIARSASASVLHRYSTAGVHLVLELPDALPSVWADETLVRQALSNLLVNAAQASAREGRVTLRLVATSSFLEFHVIDQGQGIAPELVDQLTRPFMTTRAHAGGTGLGLAIAQELARHHGGTVTIHPGPMGRGAEAIFKLPLRGA